MSNHKCALCERVILDGERVVSFDAIHCNPPYYCAHHKAPDIEAHYANYIKELQKSMIWTEPIKAWYNGDEDEITD